MELSFVRTRLTRYFVEAVTPVDPKQPEHREESPEANPCRTFDQEGVKIIDRIPGISSFQEHKSENGCRRIQRERVPQFDGVSYCKRYPDLFPLITGVRLPFSYPTQPDGFPSVKVVAGEPVATDVKPFER